MVHRSAINSDAPSFNVAPLLTTKGPESSPGAAIQSVAMTDKLANDQNNMTGGWVPNPKPTKVVKSKKYKEKEGGGGAVRRLRRRVRTRRRRLTASDARVSRRLRIRMMQRRIKKLKSRRMRGGDTNTVPQHGASCSKEQPNCAGNIAQTLLSVQAQGVANSHGDSK